MLIVISPAKTLDFESKAKTKRHTLPEFIPQSKQLIKELKQLSPAKVSALMGISDKLGVLNYDRFQSWTPNFTEGNSKQAILAFKGDVYTGLEAESFNAENFNFAQKHLRILSGLYGLLRPLDLMQAYRLEMGTKFKTKHGNNLYEFWGDTLTEALNKDLQATKSKTFVNLASNEYFKAVKPAALDAEVISPVFKDWKNGDYKIISFFAKKARGLMSAYIIRNKIKNADDILSFDLEGYHLSKKHSSDNKPVFIRKM